MSDFYVTCPSNTRVASNTTAAYECPLAHPITLEGNWEVGLAGIQYPRSWDNVSNAWLRISLFDFLHDGSVAVKDRPKQIHTFKMPNANYTSVEKAMTEVNETIRKFLKEGITKGKLKEYLRVNHTKPGRDWVKWLQYRVYELTAAGRTFSLTYVDDKMKMDFDKDYIGSIDLSPSLRYVLGFRTNSEGIASHTPRFDSHISGLYIYTNIIAFQLVGDVKVPVLRVVPVLGEIGDVNDIDYPNVHYADVLSKTFDSIEIYIRGDDGELVPFNDDRKTVVKLHFRRKRNL